VRWVLRSHRSCSCWSPCRDETEAEDQTAKTGSEVGRERGAVVDWRWALVHAMGSRTCAWARILEERSTVAVAHAVEGVDVWCSAVGRSSGRAQVVRPAAGTQMAPVGRR
jgi:hypothetical protein